MTEPDFSLDILYQDEYLLAVNKPSGLLVHRSWIDPHETRFALQMARDMIGQHVFPVHRLDRPTSGVLLFALDSDTARLVSEQFLHGQVSKRYLAVVRGYIDEEGQIDYPLKEKHDKIADRQARTDKPAQKARTRFRRLGTVELPYSVDRYPQSRYSLVELRPETGRKHQLRRHMKHIAHPIIGDPKYGKSSHNHFFCEQFGCCRLCLHALELTLNHPHTGEPLVIQAGLPEELSQLMRSLGWTDAVDACFRSA